MIAGPWVAWVSGRWFGRRSQLIGRHSSTLAKIGIATGVATLVVVMGVMNGLQSGYIEALLEVSSFHARVVRTGAADPSFDPSGALASIPGVRSVLPFREGRVLLGSARGRSAPIRLLFVPRNFAELDPGFARELGSTGEDFEAGASLVAGSELARDLAVDSGGEVGILAAVGDEDSGLSVLRLPFRVAAIFASGYYAFDSGLALAPEEALPAALADQPAWRRVWGVKLEDRFAVDAFSARLRAVLPEGYACETWKDYNRAFFGALRTEKILILFLVGLVFLVVAVNIHHSMRRIVAMRAEEIAVLRALGARVGELKTIFAWNGFTTGLAGGAFGVAAGLAIAWNINPILSALFGALNLLFPGGGSSYALQSIFYLQEVPVKIYAPETAAIGLVAAGSALVAAITAAGASSRRLPAEILRDE